MLTAENLLALWMPGLVRLGRGVKPGFDQMGLNLLGALVRMLALLVLFLVPAGVGVPLGMIAATLGLAIPVAIALGVIAGALVLAAESYAMICLSEKRYDRFDITSEKVQPDG